jgi:hypothetical protein
MKKLFAIVVLAAATGVVAAPIAGAHGVEPKANATFMGSIHVSGKKATLSVRYQCAAGENLWVSAKELASGATSKKLTKEGSSKVAAAWWESHRNQFKCDGKAHTGRFTIDRVEKGSKGKLVPGKAWVQFCVTTGTTEANTKLNLSKSGWVTVV